MGIRCCWCGSSVANEFRGACVEVLLTDPNALSESGRRRLIENSYAAAGTACDLDPIKARAGLGAAETHTPDLARWQRIALDRFVAVQLGRRDELLHSLGPEDGGAALTGRSSLPFLQHIEERSAAKETKTTYHK